MKELTSDKIKRLLQRWGFAVRNARFSRYPCDRENFPKVGSDAPVIFDVGANVGQSAIWFKHSYPKAQIYAFEPVAEVYKTLQQNVGKIDGVTTMPFALGATETQVTIPKVRSGTTQTTQVLKPTDPAHAGETETINVKTVDQVVLELGLHTIDVLKTDTEGFDLDVVAGARSVLAEKRIRYLISEVSIEPGDKAHTNFYELRDRMSEHGYVTTSFFDLVHMPGKQLHYFNAMFEPT